MNDVAKKVSRDITRDELAAICRATLGQRAQSFDLMPTEMQSEYIELVATILREMQKLGFKVLAPEEAASTSRIVLG